MNLLPDARKHILTRFYFMRVGVVSALLLAGVFVIHTTLMLPAYLNVSQKNTDRTLELSTLTARLADSQEQELDSRVEALSERAQYLATLTHGTTASGALRTFVAVPHNGLRISSFSFAEGSAARLTISGTAVSREALRAYAGALATLPYVSSVDLPISAYAKESDIPFSITVTGTLTP